jgi:hypothetical protein
VPRLGPEARPDLLVVGQLGTQHLDGDVAVEALVAGAPDLAVGAGPQQAHQAVATGEQAVDDAGRRAHRRSTALMTRRATGRDSAPPVASEPRLPPSSTTTATATCGSSAGRSR